MHVSRKDLYWTKMVKREIEEMAKSKYKFRSLSVLYRTGKDPFRGNNCTCESKIADTMHKFTNLVVTTSSVCVCVCVCVCVFPPPPPELTLDLENPWSLWKSLETLKVIQSLQGLKHNIFAVSHINKLVLYVIDESDIPCVKFCQ